MFNIYMHKGGTMGVKNKKIAILTHNYFEEVELKEPLEFLRHRGAHVAIISADKKSLQAMNHADKSQVFQADALLKDAHAHDYDALILPGGVINSDHLRMDEKAREWALDFLDSNKLIAAICHAPWLLVSADAVEERRITSYHTLQDDIRNAGGEWIDQPVVIDGNLITSRKPADLPQFLEAIAQWFK